MPAQAGIQKAFDWTWIAACAGMTRVIDLDPN
jgi:hypothetical protein